MKSIKFLVLLTVLGMFIACQGPYHKPEKKPIKIGVRDLSAAATEEAVEEEEGESIDDLVDLENKGIGPIDNVELGEEIDQAMADAGKEYFNGVCIACHQTDARMVGPAVRGIMERRSPEWVMNMILNPSEMLEKDPIAIALLEEYLSPMAYMGTSEEEARQVVEYFRTLN